MGKNSKPVKSPMNLEWVFFMDKLSTKMRTLLLVCWSKLRAYLFWYVWQTSAQMNKMTNLFIFYNFIN